MDEILILQQCPQYVDYLRDKMILEVVVCLVIILGLIGFFVWLLRD